MFSLVLGFLPFSSHCFRGLIPSDVPRMGGHSTGVMKLLRTNVVDGSSVKDESARMKNDSVELGPV